MSLLLLAPISSRGMIPVAPGRPRVYNTIIPFVLQATPCTFEETV
jgi:hypothetical protein